MKFIKKQVCLLLSATAVCLPGRSQNIASDQMQKALEALEGATQKGDPYTRAAALCDVAVVDLCVALDAEAEKYATMSEEAARAGGYPDILARALTLKANVCAFAETDNTFNRNDEGLGYALEAVQQATASHSDSLLMEACCAASQLYVNKNRWNKKIDKTLYARAGAFLDRADSLSRSMQNPPLTKLLAYRMRYYRQGSRIDEAIDYCEKVFAATDQNNPLLKAQACDHLTPLYIEAGRFQDAADAHSAYVHWQALYERAREAEKLQEMQGKYESELKDALLEKKTYQVLSLIIVILLLAVATAIILNRFFREREKRRISEKESLAKDEFINFISNDLRNPTNATSGELERFIVKAMDMDDAQITAELQKMMENRSHLSRNVADYVCKLISIRRKTLSESGLSKRELEILRLSAEGLSVPQIAEKIFISTRTVSNHKASIYSKLGVRTNAEMCRVARDSGLI